MSIGRGVYSNIRMRAVLAAGAALVAAIVALHPSASRAPLRQAVGDARAKLLLVRAYRAASWLGRHRDGCLRCYPVAAADLTEDMNHRTGDAYAIAFNPFGAHLTDVVYLDTVGRDRLSRHHITFYSRTSNGTIWQLDASGATPHLFEAE